MKSRGGDATGVGTVSENRQCSALGTAVLPGLRCCVLVLVVQCKCTTIQYNASAARQDHKKQSTRTGWAPAPATNKKATSQQPTGPGGGVLTRIRIVSQLALCSAPGLGHSRARLQGASGPGWALPHGCCCLLPRENKTRTTRQAGPVVLGGPFLLYVACTCYLQAVLQITILISIFFCSLTF
jgi:hypothetical protein